MTPPLFVAEPPAKYAVLPPLVVDCSTIAALVFREDLQAQACARISGCLLYAPSLLPYEVASVAAKKLRGGREDIAADGLDQYAQLAVELFPVEPSATLLLAHRYGLSTYDAAYLWLAAELKAPLATFDAQLAAAAQTHLAGLA